MYAIGVDSGTQGTKVLIMNFSGDVLGRGYARHISIQGLNPGDSEQAPQMWLEALEKALAEALNESGIDTRKVVCLGISGQQHGFVPLDKDGQPIRPAKLWNDTSSVKETEFLLDKMSGQKSYISKLGINLAVGYTASKILWMKRHEPKNYDRLFTVLLPHNYLNYALTGEIHMEYGDASGTGLMDIRKLQWHIEAVAAVDPDLFQHLPPLSHPSIPLGPMKKEFASRFGFDNILVSSGGGDNMMGAIGTGNVFPGVVTLSLGTSGTIYSFSDTPIFDSKGEIAAFCSSSGGWLPLLCTMNVTNTTEHLKTLLNKTNEELEDCASLASAGAKGLLFLPFLDGERVPPLPSANGVFFGLNKNTFNSSYMARAVLEGTILNLGYGFNRMKSLGINPEEIRATGGGSRSRIWLQIVANIMQIPVATLQEKEAGAFGAAIQSIWSYYSHTRGESVPIKELTDMMVKKEQEIVEPEPKTFPLYEHLQERFNSLWHKLWGQTLIT
ncbi:MAG: xylulokinase [Candidatus Aminicenantes bacterium]|nr:xylulokinase [Candidatus Aminicenantes bacterium]